MIDLDTTATTDVFTTSRYAELVENPVMYAKPDYTTFTVDGMDILIGVYSPTGKVTAESIFYMTLKLDLFSNEVLFILLESSAENILLEHLQWGM